MKFYKGLVVGLIAFALAACGGGGSSNGGSTATSSSTSNATAALYAASTSVVQPPLTNDMATDALNWTNYRRATVGLAPLTRNAALDKAAAAHVNYMNYNNSYNTEGHNETQGNAGFTGTTPPARTAAAGYTNTYISENMSATPTLSGRALTDSLIDAPYHRQAQLGPYADGGAASGISTDGSLRQYVIDFGTRNSNVGPTSQQLVTYPFNGQTGVMIDWFASEMPNPLPDLSGQRVGYPVSLGSPLATSMTLSAFTLVDDKSIAVTTRQVTTRTDNGASLGAYAFLVPLAPLVNGTKYTAHAVGTLDSKPFDVTWAFTTVPAATLVLTASAQTLPATAGSQITVTLSGGTGRSGGMVAVPVAAVASGSTLQGNFLSFTRNTTDTITITRGSTACSGIYSNCYVQVSAVDSAGTQAVLKIPMQ